MGLLWNVTKDLKNCMDSIGLVDVPSSGLQFTWSFKNVLTKLDRVLMNQEWNNLGLEEALTIFEFGGISQKASSAKVEFQEAFNCLVEDPDNVALREKVDILKKASKSLSESELSFLKQKAKCQHLLETDKGTKYYHALINKNRARSHISYIVKEDGLKTTSYMEMADLFVDFYKGLFGTRRLSKPIDLDILGKGPCVPCDDTDGLVAPITGEEIKATLWEMDGDKAPGPDGFSSTFFMANWDLVGYDLIKCVQEFFNTGKLLKQLNHTIVALIPKTNHDPMVGDFRPIGCTNVIYKVITKILTKRMTSFLPIIVDSGQTAFVKGRHISDNVFLAQEILRGYKVKRNSPHCMIMLDIQKAYDTVSWDFVENVLLGLGFPTKFVGWIMECVTTASYSISINGLLHGHLKGGRGLRQGDPISPTLFLFCIEYLSRMLKVRTSGSGFSYHPKWEFLKITHIVFEDDLMLFSRADTLSVSILLGCLHDLEEASGLTVSPTKSNIFFSGVCGLLKEELLRRVGFDMGKFPIRYLGIPLANSKVSVEQFAPFIDLMRGLLFGTLSQNMGILI
ncbi:hypothetical protein LIER_24912 [Lithospermum erythrorhizon]|uniref:Reverse transcriptase domain-containing protein n=1 Tax=Lithospermum erythrorhizon TaxID=34254 RepID=A0AAV3R8R1_LITER